jgi:type I restriction enzyme S subunit
MNELPAGWTWAELCQVCTSITDGDHQAPPQVSAGIPFLVIGNIRTRSLNFTNSRHVPREYFESLDPVRRPRKGDVLYSLVGSYGIPVLVRDDKPFCVQRHIGILRPSPQISPAFLALVLSSRAVFDQATQFATGTAQLTVPLAGLRRIRIPFPPRQEQERIVAVIEEQFSRLDAGVAVLERMRRNLRRMRASVLHAAVTGRLVPRIEDAAAAMRLVSQLCLEASTLGRRKTAVPATQYLDHVPNSWQVVALADLAESIDYGTSEKTRADVRGVPILRMGNLGWGTINYNDLKFLPREQLDPRLLLRRGDLLFNRTNSAELVGKTAVFHGYPQDIAFASYLIRVRALPSTNLEWANIVLNSPIGRRYVAAVRNQQVGQANVNGTKLAAAPIPLPSSEEQSQIIKECERLFSVIEMLEDATAAAVYRSDRLRSSVVSTAFAGELVAQDSNDEPASELLKRIAAMHAASNGRQSARQRSTTATP